jgi:hypothetical protein
VNNPVGIKQMMWPDRNSWTRVSFWSFPKGKRHCAKNKNVDSYSGFGSDDFVSEITSLDKHLRALTSSMW